MTQKPPKFTGTVDLDGDETEEHETDHEAAAAHAGDEGAANAASEFADEFDTDHDFPEGAEGEEVDLEAEAAKRKRNAALITYGGGAVFFLIIVVVGYLQFAPMFSGSAHTHAAAPVPKAPVRTAALATGSTAPLAPASNNILLPPPGSVMPNGQPITVGPIPGPATNPPMAQANDNSLAQPPQANMPPQVNMAPQAVMPQAFAPAASSMATSVSQPPSSAPSQASSNQTATPGAAQGAGTMVPAYKPLQPAQVTQPSSPVQTEPMMPANAGLAAKVDDLANKVSALQNSIATLTAAENASPQLQQIQNSLDALERQISGRAAPRQTGETLQKTEKTTPSHYRHTSHGIVKKASAKAETGDGAESTPTLRHEAPAHLESGQGGGWILRAAMPGSAMIGKPGSNDLQHIAVGDTVSGLGRITSISDAGGRWVVKGTSGSIGQ